MNNYELYDAITKIDDRLIARASLLRLNRSADRNARPAARKKIRTGAVIGIAAAVLALAVASGAAATAVRMNGAAVPKTDSPTAAPASDPASVGTGTEQPADDFPAGRVDEFVFGSEDYLSSKEYPLPFFSTLSVPSTIKNSGNFTLESAFGLDQRKGTYGYLLNGQSELRITIINRENDPGPYSDSPSSNGILIDEKNGEYSLLINSDQREELMFDAGQAVERDGNYLHLVWTNINGIDSLPYHLSLPCTINNLSKNTAGYIIAFFGVVGTDDDYLAGGSNWSRVYYYCSGDYIGFGVTKEAAYENAFPGETAPYTVEAIDYSRESTESLYQHRLIS